VIKSIMFVGSRCDLNARHEYTEGDGMIREGCGLMQLSPTTANQYLYACRTKIPGYCKRVHGVEQCISNFRMTCDMLRSTEYVEASVCLASEHLSSIMADPNCGKDMRSVFAGYYSGASACLPSKNCPTEIGCGGFGMQNWECPYANSAHAVCSEGPASYKNTKTYVKQALACTAVSL
jgi:hypothetical protein